MAVSLSPEPTLLRSTSLSRTKTHPSLNNACRGLLEKHTTTLKFGPSIADASSGTIEFVNSGGGGGGFLD